MKNIGFYLQQKNKASQNNVHYVISDLDLLPSHNLIQSYIDYPQSPIHLANKGTRYTMNNENSSFFGGAISVNQSDFKQSNGYPNNFWGWGGEDEALRNRMKKQKLVIQKPEFPVIDLEDFSTVQDKLKFLKDNQMKELRKREKVNKDKLSWETQGLNDIESTFTLVNQSQYQEYPNVSRLSLN